MTNYKRMQAEMSKEGFDALVLTDDKNIQYVTNFRPTDSIALVTTTGVWLITDSRYTEEAARHCFEGVEIVLHTIGSPLVTELIRLLKESGAQKVGAEDGIVSYKRYLELQEKTGYEFLPAQDFIIKLREIKTREELQFMIDAQRIAERVLEEVLAEIKVGMTEREIAAKLSYLMKLYGAEGDSFDPIVVSGPNSSLPHGVPGDRKLQDGDFVTMDFGCTINGYCSDMTRTVAIGHATEEMRKVYETVLAAQVEGMKLVKAGVPGADVHAIASKIIGDAGYGAYFGHGYGHGVGLDIHEQPRLAPAGKTGLPAGAVVTAEPGIYLPGKFGVRIEDMLFVTEEGAEVLTKAPKELIIL